MFSYIIFYNNDYCDILDANNSCDKFEIILVKIYKSKIPSHSHISIYYYC